MRDHLLKIAVAAAILPFTLAGCATFHQAHKQIHTTNTTVSRSLSQQRDMKSVPIVQTVNTPFLMGAEVRIRQGEQVPSLFIHLATSQPLTLSELATQITQMTGIPVHIASQVKGFLDGNNGTGSTGSALPSLPGQPAGFTGMPILPDESSNKNSLSIKWKGKLSGLLNLVAARTGTYWKYEDGGVRFFLTETRAFSVNALPGSTSMTANITNSGTNGASGGSGASSGSTGSTSQSATMSSTLDIYKSIVNGINTVLIQSKSAGGGGTNLQIPTSVSANQSTGQILVTATPPELRAVEAYMRTINQQMEKNVLIDVHVYSVQLDHANDYGLNLNAAFNSIANRYGISVSGPAAISPPAGMSPSSMANLAAVILGPVDGNGFYAANNSSDLANGSQYANGSGSAAAQNTPLVAQALATQGDVSLVTSGSIIALNGQPTPLQVAKQVSYLASTSTTQTANIGSSTQLTPGQFTTGFSGTFLPLVRGKHILLEYTINLTQNNGLQTFTSGGSTIELPNLSTQAFVQRVSLKSGQTLVLSGFEDKSSAINHNGVGSAHFWGLGGGANAESNRTALVVVIHIVKLGD
ncbi:MAG: hypothetical protein PHX24_02125 [Acidithiobacillus sp.]|nr:hypothetical protein [Acidithiobacillus sp.]